MCNINGSNDNGVMANNEANESNINESNERNKVLMK